MSEHQELVPVPDPADDPRADAKSRWDKLIEDLQQERDELRVRLHLARKEARDELDRLDARIDELKVRARAVATEADDAFDDIEGAAKVLWGEIKDGFARVRKSFTD